MIWAWGLLGFLTGVLFWHYVGIQIFKLGMNNDKILEGVLRNMSNQSLHRFHTVVQKELVERKQDILDWEKIK